MHPRHRSSSGCRKCIEPLGRYLFPLRSPSTSSMKAWPNVEGCDALSNTQLLVEFNVFEPKKVHFAASDFIAGEALADDRHSQTSRHEALDHLDAGQLHLNLQVRRIRAKKTVP